MDFFLLNPFFNFDTTLNSKNIVISQHFLQCNIPKFVKIHVYKDEILNKIVTKFQKI